MVSVERLSSRCHEDSPSTLTTMSNLATFYRRGKQGKYTRAEKHGQSVARLFMVVSVERLSSRGRKDNPSTLTFMNNLVNFYRRVSKASARVRRSTGRV